MNVRELTSIYVTKETDHALTKLHERGRVKRPNDFPESYRDFLVMLLGVGADMVTRALDTENLIQPAATITKEMVEAGARLRKMRAA